MAAERSESGDSSDGGGRRGQQQCPLRLHCYFVAIGGIGCSKGVAVIEKDEAAVCTVVAEEGSGSIERETTANRVHFDAGRDQDSW
ncbi:hypothetical protein BHE74_00016017 [Ensete ventricosum]|nr:hypothetical protein BHE74_00016017 [Ensete ventricosum]RZR83467.1 hypothetical protein BHM03_00010069 [Ensete ventricosum]